MTIIALILEVFTDTVCVETFCYNWCLVFIFLVLLIEGIMVILLTYYVI
jgi:hypothetical protein